MGGMPRAAIVLESRQRSLSSPGTTRTILTLFGYMEKAWRQSRIGGDGRGENSKGYERGSATLTRTGLPPSSRPDLSVAATSASLSSNST